MGGGLLDVELELETIGSCSNAKWYNLLDLRSGRTVWQYASGVLRKKEWLLQHMPDVDMVRTWMVTETGSGRNGSGSSQPCLIYLSSGTETDKKSLSSSWKGLQH